MGGAGGGGCARCAAVVTAAGAEYSNLWDRLIPKLRVEASFIPLGQSWVPDGGAFLQKSVPYWREVLRRMEREEEDQGGMVRSVAFSMDGSKIAAGFNVYDDEYGGVKIFRVSNQPEGSAGFVCQSTLC